MRVMPASKSILRTAALWMLLDLKRFPPIKVNVIFMWSSRQNQTNPLAVLLGLDLCSFLSA
jgi:hypothetical protein